MALQDHKQAINRVFLIFLVLCVLCFALFSCVSYIESETTGYVDMDTVTLVQLDEPEDDAPAFCMHTTVGDIVAELYPDEAPAYVEQFTTLAEEGYYDNTYIFQVESEVYFEGGSPNSDGSTDTDEYENVELELSGDLWPFRGAFCAPIMSQEGNIWERLTGDTTSYVGSCFVVCDTIEFDDDTIEEMEEVSDTAQEVTDAFLELGGIPNYSQQMTIFAQAYGEESLETIDAITEAEVGSESGENAYTAPVEDIMITSIEIGVYSDFVSDES